MERKFNTLLDEFQDNGFMPQDFLLEYAYYFLMFFDSGIGVQNSKLFLMRLIHVLGLIESNDEKGNRCSKSVLARMFKSAYYFKSNVKFNNKRIISPSLHDIYSITKVLLDGYEVRFFDSFPTGNKSKPWKPEVCGNQMEIEGNGIFMLFNNKKSHHNSAYVCYRVLQLYFFDGLDLN